MCIRDSYKVGDIIDAYEIGYDEKNDKEIIETVKLKVLATTEDLLPGQLSSSYMGLDFITYDEVGQKLGFNINKGRMYISCLLYTSYRFENSILVVVDGNEYRFNDITDIHIVRSDLKLKLLRRSDFEFWKRASEKFL